MCDMRAEQTLWRLETWLQRLQERSVPAEDQNQFPARLLLRGTRNTNSRAPNLWSLQILHSCTYPHRGTHI